MTSENFIDLPPLLSARGTITLPGSKSISNRILLLSALAQGTTEIRDVLLSDDTEHMLDGLRTLGVAVEQLESHVFRVQGCGGNFPVKQAELFLGNAGTAFRPLTAALALSGGDYKLSGAPRMHAGIQRAGVFDDAGLDRGFLDHRGEFEDVHVGHAAIGVAVVKIAAKQRELIFGGPGAGGVAQQMCCTLEYPPLRA